MSISNDDNYYVTPASLEFTFFSRWKIVKLSLDTHDVEYLNQDRKQRKCTYETLFIIQA